MEKFKFSLFTVLIIAILLIIAALSGFAYSLSGAARSSENGVKIMHISDIHYIPTYYCYTANDTDNDYTKQMEYDPKLMLESGSVMSSVFNTVRNELPDYLLISGDLSSNGERQGLVDVANALRKLQNDVRKLKPRFQIFVTPGNHDVHNRQYATDYSSGSGVSVESVTRNEFEKIFASLGYPDMNESETDNFYTYQEKNADKHLPYDTVGSAYVNSETASGIEIEYLQENGSRIYTPGGLSYIAYDNINDYSFISFDTPLANEKEGYRTDGAFTETILSWYENQKVKGVQVGLSHHNILPHYSMEENFTDEYITYNWEDVAERLANKGLRYNFTGHMHASDMANYVSFENNILYDIETASTISYSPAIRIAEIKKSVNDRLETAENIESRLISVSSADFGYLVNNGLMPEGYEQLLDRENNIDLPEYIERRLFSNMITNMADLYISPRLKATIKDLLTDLIPINVSTVIDKLLENMIREINIKALADYRYSGANQELTGNDNKIFAYLSEMVYRIIDYKVTDSLSVNDLFLYCYGAHLSGGEAKCPSELPANIQKALDKLNSGEVTADLVNILLNSKGGLLELAERIGNKKLDLTASMTKSEIALVNTVFKMLKIDVKADNIVLDKLIPVLSDSLNIGIKADTLKGAADELSNKYLTKSLTDGLGGILASIIESFAVDNTYDGKVGESIVYKIAESDKYSYSGVYDNYLPTVENGRLPSMATVTFGNDPCSDKNFVWFTSKYIDSGELQYRKVGANAWNTAKAETIIIPYANTLADFGIFSSKNVKYTARHNVRLSGLDSGTKYEYRIGNSEYNYFSEKGFFKTADSGNAPFEIAVIADLQGMVNSVYENADKLLSLSNSLFANGTPDFVINLGDFVDDGLNSNQWKYALNTPSEYWRNVTQVIAAGNHEEKLFNTADYEFPSGAPVDNFEYSPINLHYDLNGVGLSAKQYYSFDYSAVHFTVLDTNDLTDEGKLSNAQYEWLMRDLENSDKEYIIVSMHKGLYSSGSHSFDNDVKALRAQLSGLFYKTKVDIVFQGHDHTYSESAMLDGGGKPSDDGVLYITMGTMGDKFYNYAKNDFVVIEFGDELHNTTLPGQTFGKLSFDGEKLSYDGYIFDGDKFIGVREYGKNLLWLWITLGCFGGAAALIGIGVITLFVLKKRK